MNGHTDGRTERNVKTEGANIMSYDICKSQNVMNDDWRSNSGVLTVKCKHSCLDIVTWLTSHSRVFDQMIGPICSDIVSCSLQ